MNNNINIRKFNINSDHWSSNWIPISYLNSLNNYKLNKSITYLWSKDNKVNGIIRAYYINSKQIEIGDLWINPKYRGKIYKKTEYKYSYEFLKKIINKIWNDFPNTNIITLIVSKDNISAIKLYKKFGFKVLNKNNKNFNNKYLIKIDKPMKMIFQRNI